MRVAESLHVLLAKARELPGRRRRRRELDEELEFHIASETELNIRRGMSATDARRAAMQAFGGVERYRQEANGARGFAALDALLRETRLTVRRLRRTPTFAFGVIATLGIALGAAGAIGSLVYSVMLRELPYTDPDRLVRISILTPGLHVDTPDQSAGTYVYLTERARSFSMVGASMENEGIAITDGEEPERVTGALVTPSLFRVLGTTAAAGRVLQDEDASAGVDSPVLISHELWQRRFSGDRNIAGKFIELNRRRRMIVGVLPADFDYPSHAAAVYYPERVTAERAGLSSRYLSVVARLAPGVSTAQAQAELDALMPRLRERFPDLSASDLAASGLTARVTTLRAAIIGPVRAELTLLSVMMIALLLIATANVTTLSLLRAQRLRGEIAVTRALGASNAIITLRFVVEGVCLALTGGLVALPLGALAVRARFGLDESQLPRLHTVAMTIPAMNALLGVSVAIGVMLGLVSAARATARSSGGPTDALRGDTRTTRSRAWRRAQESLVAFQIALALSLLLATGLLGSSLLKLSRVNVGFVPADAATFSIQLPFRAYPTYQRTAAFDLAVIDALRAVPGVRDVGAAMQFPSTPQWLYARPQLETTRGTGQTAQALVTANVVSADFFRTMRIPMLAGRAFADGDLASASPGVIIGALLARELFGVESPIGKEVRLASSPRAPAYHVVGVSGDVYGDRLTDGPLRVLYFPLLGDLPPTSTETEQRVPFMPAGMHFVVRSALSLETLRPIFRRAVASVDSRVPMWDVRTLDAIVAASTARARLTMTLLGIAGAMTLVLGVIGLYSVIAYAVAGRAREFAVRLAIGATPREITRQILREGAVVAGVGIAAGLAVSVASGGILRGLLYEVRANDPVIHLVAVLIVLTCTAAATFAPAWRAGRTDPVRALHAE